MTATQTGIAIGAILAISWATFGFWPFVGIAVAIAIGAVIGRIVDGKLDAGALVDAVRGKRSSS